MLHVDLKNKKNTEETQVSFAETASCCKTNMVSESI